MMSKSLFIYNYVSFSMLRGTPALPTATRPLKAARPRHACPTQQPPVSPSKEGAPQPNSATGGRRKTPSRGRPWNGGGSLGREGFPYFSEAFPFRDFVFASHVLGSISLEGVFSGDEILPEWHGDLFSDWRVAAPCLIL